MKKTVLIAAMIGLAQASIALASPISLPDGPVYIKFNNVEQISPTNSIVTPDGNHVDNWGLVKVTQLSFGGVPPANQLFAQGLPFWTEASAGQITGIFNGATATASAPGTINSTNGSLYLYWSDTKTLPGGFLPTTLADIAANWTSDFVYTGVADPSTMTLLAKVDFLNGGILGAFPATSITGSAVPSSDPFGFSGLADSFGTVDLLAGGAWATQIDTDFFNTNLGPHTADVRFKNSYNDMRSWDQLGAAGGPIFGAVSDDPARVDARAVPEPATLTLVGLGLLAAGMFQRRRKA